MKNSSSILFSVGFLVVWLCGVEAEARLGETSQEFNVRYGRFDDSGAARISQQHSPILKGAMERTWNYKGWNIRAAFAEEFGPCIRIRYLRPTGAGDPKIKEHEINAILNANGSGWKEVKIQTSNRGLAGAFEGVLREGTGERRFQGDAGLQAKLRIGILLILETPAAEKLEALAKERGEQESREAMPDF